MFKAPAPAASGNANQSLNSTSTFGATTKPNASTSDAGLFGAAKKPEGALFGAPNKPATSALNLTPSANASASAFG